MSTQIYVPKGNIISNEVKNAFDDVINVWGSLAVAVVGVVTNILTIWTFSKQGVSSDRTTVSLTAIAGTDLISCFTGIGYRILIIAGFFDPVAAFNLRTVNLTTFQAISFISAVTSGAFTAYLAVERCIAVVWPFKVKYILTVRLTKVIISLLAILVATPFILLLTVRRWVWKFFAPLNTTVLWSIKIKYYEDNYDEIRRVTYAITTFWPLITITVMVVGTLIILFHLRKMSKQKLRADGKIQASFSAREIKVTRMLVVVIAVYIVAIIPRIVIYMLNLTLPGFIEGGRYSNFNGLLFLLVNFFNLLNATVNFFIYYNLSSTFKKTFSENIAHVLKCKTENATQKS